MSEKRIRIYMTGVGGQGTLTATSLLARVALDQGVSVVAGEVHGMAQRGGVVESVVLLGGWLSPKLDHGEADILLGFEPLESLRGLPYLAPQGVVFSSTDFLPPLNVSMGKDILPDLDSIKAAVGERAGASYFMPCRTLGLQAGSVQCGNTVLLAALVASGLLPFGLDALEAGIKKHLPPKLVEGNIKALHLGVEALGFA